MTLGFSTQMFGEPNHFPEKILSGMLKSLENEENNNLLEVPEYIYSYGEKVGYSSADTVLQVIDNAIPKLHTMREDPHNRWKAGMDIHMVINNRTKNRFQFAPTIKCVSTQEVIISYRDFLDGKYHVAGWFVSPRIIIDGRTILEHEVEELAINDGFESVNDFFEYFSSSCTRKLIHWTDLRY